MDTVTDLDLLRARIAEAEIEQARLFEVCDARFRSVQANETEEARAELQTLYARAEDARDRLFELQNELRRSLGQEPWPR